MLGKSLIAAATSTGAGAEALYIESVFQTWLYTGNGSTQTITNGIDLAGEGGLVWCKSRSDATLHEWVDTVRGVRKRLDSASTGAEVANADLEAFNSDGFRLGFHTGGANSNATTYTSWTFRKAPKFFDIVTYTGNGSTQSISHNLGSIPGFIIVKRTDSTGNWICWHRSIGSSGYILLNSTAAQGGTSGAWPWNNTAPTDATFTVGYDVNVTTEFQPNLSGGTFVAYLFAHDEQIFGEGGNQSVIKCGSYTGNGSTSGPVIDLGWEPQWVLLKAASAAGTWILFDTMRGIVTDGNDTYLLPNNSSAENSLNQLLELTPTGFWLRNSSGGVNGSGVSYIYIAIRRGPMKTPTSGAEVLTLSSFTSDVGTWNVPDPVDMVLGRRREGGDGYIGSRLTGNKQILSTNSTSAEVTASAIPYAWKWDSSSTQMSSQLYINMIGTLQAYSFRRAPGFFDVVAYTGNGSANTVAHNLGVTPEILIIKSRTTNGAWEFEVRLPGYSTRLRLNQTDAQTGAVTTITSTYFSWPVGYGGFNVSGTTYIAYLFATCPGVSKVGSYTGTGATLQVDCGFASGARLVIIKRTDNTGDWYVWDTARGIVSGNDPYLLLNSTAAEVTSTDYIDPYSAGFEISSTAPAAINASGGSFIYLAIA